MQSMILLVGFVVAMVVAVNFVNVAVVSGWRHYFGKLVLHGGVKIKNSSLESKLELGRIDKF